MTEDASDKKDTEAKRTIHTYPLIRVSERTPFRFKSSSVQTGCSRSASFQVPV